MKTKQKHILLIDDDHDEMDIFIEALNDLPISYECTYAESGEQAFQLLEHIQPDIIFLDQNMPKNDGIYCLGKLRTMDAVRFKPIILYSTGLTDDLKVKAMDKGATGCIKKPSHLYQLTDVLKRVIIGTD